MLRFAGRGILIGFAMAACVMCLKARQAQSPMGLARELQRNLSIVNIAAVRRRGMPRQSPRVVRPVAAGRPTSSPTDLIPGMQYQVGDRRRI